MAPLARHGSGPDISPRRTARPEYNKSAYPPIADIQAGIGNGSEVPIADMRPATLDFSHNHRNTPTRQLRAVADIAQFGIFTRPFVKGAQYICRRSVRDR